MTAMATKVINFRAPEAKHKLIKLAADVTEQNLTAFMLSTLCEKAEEVLADQARFTVNRQVFDRFNELIEAPLSPSSQKALRKLFSTPSPWEL